LESPTLSHLRRLSLLELWHLDHSLLNGIALDLLKQRIKNSSLFRTYKAISSRSSASHQDVCFFFQIKKVKRKSWNPKPENSPVSIGQLSHIVYETGMSTKIKRHDYSCRPFLSF
jgi:hypothetical protein